MKPSTEICQSCGMPLNGVNNGTNADFSPSTEFCIHCFENGSFVIPDLTLQQQIVRLTRIAVEKMGISEPEARKMAEKTLPRLKRWKTNFNTESQNDK